MTHELTKFLLLYELTLVNVPFGQSINIVLFVFFQLKKCHIQFQGFFDMYIVTILDIFWK